MDSKPSLISRVDLAIIGGGINGAGLAALAAQAGLSTALFEKGDFGSGTSSKSTKLIHGGIRYLEQARLPLVSEALHERRHLMDIAPHLVRPISFLLPCYKEDRRPPWMLKTGLWLYDFLAGSKNIAPHQWFSPAEALLKAPNLNPSGLKGCGLYFDAQVNDARLVLENILLAEKAGSKCFNFCRVIQIDNSPPQLRVFYHDDRSNEGGVLTASCLVNASGPWANETAKLISVNALKMVRPTRGTHIVVPEVLSSHAVLITTGKDNRIIFIIPWRGYSLVGTTDLDDSENPDKAKPSDEEIQYLLTESARVFPSYNWERKKIIAAFAGLRPLAWSDNSHASSVSREDRLIKEGNVLTIVGGKLTTYHSMAQKALKEVLIILNKPNISGKIASLPGTPNKSWNLFLNENTSLWPSKYEISESLAQHLTNLYGCRAEQILELIVADPRLREPLHAERPEILAQVFFAVHFEKALHLDDVFLRRLEIGYSPQRWGTAPEKASKLMAELLNWDENTRLEELKNYKSRIYPQP